jgi:putative colanic acid biosynthesis acetyltransferase WcaF
VNSERTNLVPTSNDQSPALDIATNRSALKWTRRELAGRVLWGLAQPFFRLSPRPFWGWRRFLLRAFGAMVGHEVHMCPTVRITIPWNLRVGAFTAVGDRATLYNLGIITIGEFVTVSQNAHLCGGSHDYRRTDLQLLKLPIQIGDGAWICADAFIGPNVTVGAHAIVGARAVVTKDVDVRAIVAGNPARRIGSRPYPVQS